VLELKHKGTTIFINSHLLMEVEMVCDRVVIMDKGRILREGTIAELTPYTGAVRFEIDPVPEDLTHLLAGVGAGLTRHDHGFDLAAGPDEVDRAVDLLRGAGVSIRSLMPRRLNLEQTFIDLVKAEADKDKGLQ
jgi:ABC-2 type transport system ATP-binding protein